MGKFSAAKKLADEAGMAFDDAWNFVKGADDGAEAQKAADDALSTFEKAEKGAKLGIAGGSAAGGTLLGIEYLENQEIQAKSNQQQKETIQDVLADDELSFKKKQEVLGQLEELNKSSTSSSEDEGVLDGILGDPFGMAIALVVIVVVIRQAMEDK